MRGEWREGVDDVYVWSLDNAVSAACVVLRQL